MLFRSNTDNMPHNFAIVAPGSLEEVGLLAEATARDKDAKDRQFVPKSDRIMLASRLLEPGQTQALSFVVPKEPGIYPYVCTYPGHWRRMYGALYVVADLPKYLANPEAYLAASLPALPFEDGSFDLVLCGHLLMAYAPLADGGLYEEGCFNLAWQIGRAHV